jgi:hypothetical protein
MIMRFVRGVWLGLWLRGYKWKKGYWEKEF